MVALTAPARITVGRLGTFLFEAGSCVYVGSARRGLAARVARHRRLGEGKSGKLHWHVDYLLTHPDSRLVEAIAIPGGDECTLAAGLAGRSGVTIPVPHLGATDCRNGCPAHLFRTE